MGDHFSFEGAAERHAAEDGLACPESADLFENASDDHLQVGLKKQDDEIESFVVQGLWPSSSATDSNRPLLALVGPNNAVRRGPIDSQRIRERGRKSSPSL